MLKLSISHADDLWAMIIVTPWVGSLLLAQDSYLCDIEKQALGCFLHDLIIIYSVYAYVVVQSTFLSWVFFLFLQLIWPLYVQSILKIRYIYYELIIHHALW